MAFLETPRLPDCISFGAKGGPEFSTDVITTRAGHESRNANIAQARHRFEIGMGVKPKTIFDMIRNHFFAVGGRRDAFRYKDWADFEVSQSNGVLRALHSTTQVGTGSGGYGTPSSQLQKAYTAGALTHYRDIRKPRSVTLYRDGVAITAGVGAGQVSNIDTATGIVTIVADQSRAISAHTPGASHQVVLGSAFSPNILVGGRIYFTDITGTAATVLNGLSHEVSVVSSATINILTNTAGLTASGGTAYFYPQPTEVLTWAGEFDVPVRFDVDGFDAVIIDRGEELLIDLPSVPLIEVRV